MKKFGVLLLAAVLIPGCASAASFNVPESKPLASVVVPDSWEPNAYDGGVEGTSKDGTTYVAFEVVEANDVESATKDALGTFIKGGVEIDPKSAKQKDTKINNIDAFELSYEGKEKGKVAHVSLTIAPLDAKHFLFVSYWGSPEGEKANLEDLMKIEGSIKKLN
eukprot:gene10668-10740_t